MMWYTQAALVLLCLSKVSHIKSSGGSQSSRSVGLDLETALQDP